MLESLASISKAQRDDSTNLVVAYAIDSASTTFVPTFCILTVSFLLPHSLNLKMVLSLTTVAKLNVYECSFLLLELTEIPFFAFRIKLGKNGVEAIISADLQGFTKHEAKGL
ncbi:hypothetical protein FRX31_006861 [Thalictrum thalictroides]|uniref:Uncharacterized protein n=1 Tax=Thalictrum thalictroides TaxID=46969 RepID=A0A7J6X1D7_THATH|nr:hypothetical protein FRX31_006861 [Thalictrum thalictroides]